MCSFFADFSSYYFDISDNFNGVACASDGKCAYLGTTCNFVEGVCHVKLLAEVEVEYVKCYLETIPSSVEVIWRKKK